MKKRSANEVLNTITELCEARGWNIAKLSRESGVSDSTIRSWYKRENIPSLPTLEPVCRALGTSVAEILGLDDEPVNITSDQKLLLYKWGILSEGARIAAMHVVDQFIASEDRSAG